MKILFFIRTFNILKESRSCWLWS